MIRGMPLRGRRVATSKGEQAMRILIIGGTGFSGPYTVRRLHAMGHEVTVFHSGQHEADLPPDVRHIHGARQRLPEFAEEFKCLAPDVVLHMVAHTEQDAQMAMSVFRGIARRAIVISSIDVYLNYGVNWGTEPGPAYPHPFTEDGPLRQNLYPHRNLAKGPDDAFYHYEKILVERVFMSNPFLPGTVLRLPMVYGPGDHRLHPYLKRMDDNRPVILLQEEQARWCGARGYLENIADAIALVTMDERATGRIYHVAEPEVLPEAEWVRRIGHTAGWTGRVVTLPRDRMPTHLKIEPGRSAHWIVDTTRIRQELGYREAVPQDEALRRTVAGERAHPPGKIDPAKFDYAAEDAALAGLRETADG
jgi:nucleoside-diphosphate-sugar epimerase